MHRAPCINPATARGMWPTWSRRNTQRRERRSAQIILLLIALAGTTVAFASGNRVIDIRSTGVKGDGTTIDGPAIQAALVQQRDAQFYFPQGDYLLDNYGQKKDGLTIGPSFRGSLLFAPGARLVCNTATTLAGNCLHLIHAEHVLIRNLTLDYLQGSKLPMRRADATGFAFVIDSSAHIKLLGVHVRASSGGCFWASNSTSLWVSYITVQNCTSDGVHFENDTSVTLTHMWSLNTQDDGLAFTNVAADEIKCGAVASDIHIKRSFARGISAPGGCMITIRRFSVDTTGSSGLLVDTEPSYKTRRPHHVRFEQGVVHDAGVLPSAGQANKYGVEINAADHVVVSLVRVEHAAGNGLDVFGGSSQIRVSHTLISHSRRSGVCLVGSRSIAMTDVTVEDAAGYGVYIARSGDVTFDDVTLRHVATGSPEQYLHRALWIDDAKGTIRGHRIHIADRSPTATGFVVGGSGNYAHNIDIQGISADLAAGSIRVEANSEERFVFVR
jgi:hypothetical protein